MGIYIHGLAGTQRHDPGTVVTDRPGPPAPQGRVVAAPHMTEDAWRSSATTDVLFPDDVEGFGPLCVVGEPIDATEADTDTVQYGVVAELDGDHHQEDYLVAPRQLRALIADAWRPDDQLAAFEVTGTEKSGPADDAEWDIEGRVIEDGDPL